MTVIEQIQQLALAGIGRVNAEATVGHKFNAEELAVFRSARTRWELLEAKRKRDKAANRISKAEQERRRRAKADEVVIPPCANPRRRAKCEKSLVAFLETYCMENGGLLERKPSKSMYPIIEDIQKAVSSAGWYHIRMPRGHGKTSYVKGGIAYALAYGFRKFVVAVAAAGENASNILQDIFAVFEQSDTFAEDFPEIAVPLRALEGKTQRAKSLTVDGVPCNIRVNAKEIRLPVVKGYPSSGGIINAVGFSANARGKVRGKLRPDLVIFDDLQDEELAKNPELVKAAELNIEKNFLNLGGHTKTIAALMTSTPIEPDDLSEVFAHKDTWYTATYTMVAAWPDLKDTLWEEYRSIRRHERINGRNPSTACNRFYRKHRKLMDRGAKVLNPDNYDRGLEVSGIQHAMNLYFNGEVQFMSEYQMQPKRQQLVFVLKPGTVVKRTRAEWQPYYIPPESVMTVLATDLNPSYGYSSAMVTFDRVATATVIWYGIHKTSIHKERMTEAEYRGAVYNQLVVLANLIKLECSNRGIKLDAWAIDAGGDQFEPVVRFWRNAKDIGVPFEVVPMIGKAGKTWNPFVRSKIRHAINETVECGDCDRDGNRQRWTNFNADYWRETMQRAWLGEIGTPGGLSLFGGSADVRHDDFALQVSAEQLRKKELMPEGRYKYEWAGGETNRHDYGDAATMCLAVAGNKGLTQGVEYIGKASKKAKIVFL
jgi:hypothetical protein